MLSFDCGLFFSSSFFGFPDQNRRLKFITVQRERVNSRSLSLSLSDVIILTSQAQLASSLYYRGA